MIFPPPHTTIDKGHGRIEKRKIQVAPVKEGQTNFPYAAQFIKVIRSTTDLKGNNLSKDTAYLVTSLSCCGLVQYKARIYLTPALSAFQDRLVSNHANTKSTTIASNAAVMAPSRT